MMRFIPFSISLIRFYVPLQAASRGLRALATSTVVHFHLLLLSRSLWFRKQKLLRECGNDDNDRH